MADIIELEVTKDGHLRLGKELCQKMDILGKKVQCIVRNGSLTILAMKEHRNLIPQLLKDYPVSPARTLEEVRAAASGIKGSMAETVIQDREDRI